MKRIHVVILLSFAGSVLLVQAGCHESAQSGQQAKLAGPPKIAFADLVCDFGEVGPGTEQTGRFEFVNAGDGPLEISEVKRCCGVVAKLADGKKVYAPGERGIVGVQYHAASHPMSMTRHIYVNSNDTDNPRVKLTVKAEIVSKVDYQPQRVKLSLADEESLNPTITLISIDDKPFSIESITATNRCVTADVDPAVEATKFVLPLEVDVAKLEGRTYGNIGLRLTHPQCGRLLIPFTVLQKYRAIPSQIYLLNAVPQESVIRTLSVVSESDPDFEIESTEVETGFVKVVKQARTANGYRLDLEITPPAREGERRTYTDRLHLHVGQHDLAIRVRAVYPAEYARAEEVEGK
jgi:hypothetical protein